MIVYDLECRSGRHRFEGWFGSSQDFADQQARGLVTCPHCGGSDVVKAVMAPAVGRKGNQIAERTAPLTSAAGQSSPDNAAAVSATGPADPSAATMPADMKQVFEALGALQAEALKGSRWVGKGFVEQSRAMHYGEREDELIHGQATVEEARELLEEGVAVMPLPFPVVPPEQAN